MADFLLHLISLECLVTKKVIHLLRDCMVVISS